MNKIRLARALKYIQHTKSHAEMYLPTCPGFSHDAYSSYIHTTSTLEFEQQIVFLDVFFLNVIFCTQFLDKYDSLCSERPLYCFIYSYWLKKRCKPKKKKKSKTNEFFTQSALNDPKLTLKGQICGGTHPGLKAHPIWV